MLQTKSVHSHIDRQRDGLRILATRFRGRGLPASRYDVWMPSLGPSEQLLRRVLHGKVTWAAFAKEFRKELVLSGAIERAVHSAVALKDPRQTCAAAPARRTSSTTARASAVPGTFSSMMIRVPG